MLTWLSADKEPNVGYNNGEIYDCVEEYDETLHVPNVLFTANYGKGLSHYTWILIWFDEKRYAAAKLCPSKYDFMYLYQRHCQCDYCKAPRRSRKRLFTDRADYGCLKSREAWKNIDNIMERTRDYIVAALGHSLAT
jgi:hypothetical protein